MARTITKEDYRFGERTTRELDYMSKVRTSRR
jgi:hypothetical protein